MQPVAYEKENHGILNMQLTIVIVLLLLTGCSTTYPNQKIENTIFPSISGTSLEQEKMDIPEIFDHERTLLLIGYKQDSQFDIDRWLIALDMADVNVPVYELPTIQGMLPRMFKTYINNGMRKGIPKPLWKGVITVYEDGEQIQKFTGNVNPNNTRVVLIDNSGKVLYFYDQGFSVDALNAVRELL